MLCLSWKSLLQVMRWSLKVKKFSGTDAFWFGRAHDWQIVTSCPAMLSHASHDLKKRTEAWKEISQTHWKGCVHIKVGVYWEDCLPYFLFLLPRFLSISRHLMFDTLETSISVSLFLFYGFFFLMGKDGWGGEGIILLFLQFPFLLLYLFLCLYVCLNENSHWCNKCD